MYWRTACKTFILPADCCAVEPHRFLIYNTDKQPYCRPRLPPVKQSSFLQGFWKLGRQLIEEEWTHHLKKTKTTTRSIVTPRQQSAPQELELEGSNFFCKILLLFPSYDAIFVRWRRQLAFSRRWRISLVTMTAEEASVSNLWRECLREKAVTFVDSSTMVMKY